MLVAGAAGLAQAGEPGGLRFAAEFGLGTEAQSSPLVRISPQGTPVYLDGLRRLRGDHLHAGVDAFVDHPLGGGLSVSLAGGANAKRAPASPDFDFSNLSVQPALHAAIGHGSVGLGLSRQRIDVAGDRFRDASGVQFDWTVAAGDDHGSLLVERVRWRHPGELADLDAVAATLMAQWHAGRPAAGLDGVDLSVYAGRERNDRGFRELSNRTLAAQAAVQWKRRGADWSAGLAWQRARFDEAVFAGESPRRDRTASLDLAVQWPLAESRALRLDWTLARSRSTTRLYDHRYRQLSVGYRVDL